MSVSLHGTEKIMLLLRPVADPGFAKTADHGECAELEPKQGRPGAGQGGFPSEAESFLYIFIQKVAEG